jgi:hypothetical protein
VFEAWVRGFGLTRRSYRRVDLPLAWARRHENVVVAFEDWSRDNWHAYLVGDNGAVLLDFTWDDHADRLLVGEPEKFPVAASEEAWWGREQEWFVWVKAEGDDVYMAEGSFEDIGYRVRNPRKLAPVRPGVVSVDGFEVRWNVASRAAYDGAWQDATLSCREGRPSPLLAGLSASEETRHGSGERERYDDRDLA